MPSRGTQALPRLLRKLENLEEMARVNYETLIKKVEDTEIRSQLERIMVDEEVHKELLEKAISLVEG